MKKIEFAEVLETRVRDAQFRINDFTLKLKKSPADALEWSEKIFEDAATVQVLAQVSKLLRNKGIDAALEVATRETDFKARHPHFSTSAASNLMAIYMLRAWADIKADLQELKGAWGE